MPGVGDPDPPLPLLYLVRPRIDYMAKGLSIAEHQAEEDAFWREFRSCWKFVRYENGKFGCPNCGRFRLELCANGRVVCEKCHFEPAVDDYCWEHLRLWG